MTQPDTPNLSDEILLKLRDAGWIGPLTEGAAATTLPKRRRPPKPRPAGLTLPQGVVWDRSVGRFVARIWVDRQLLCLGRCGAVQGDVDRLGVLWARARALRDAGANVREEMGV